MAGGAGAAVDGGADGDFHARAQVGGGFGAEGEDGAAEFVADGYGEGFFRYGVGGYGGEAGMVVRFVGVLGGVGTGEAYLGPAKYSWRSGGGC